MRLAGHPVSQRKSQHGTGQATRELVIEWTAELEDKGSPPTFPNP